MWFNDDEEKTADSEASKEAPASTEEKNDENCGC